MTFSLLLFLTLLLGFFSYYKKQISVVVFLFLICIYPTTGLMGSSIRQGGLYFYEFYFFAIYIAVIFRIREYGKLSGLYSLILTIMIFYFIISLMRTEDYFFVINDIRLLISITTIFVVVSFLKRGVEISELTAVRLIVFAASLNLLHAVLYMSGLLPIELLDYSKDNYYRYSGIASSICSAFLLYVFFNLEKFKKDKIFIIAILLAFITLMLSNSRIVIFALLFSLIIFNVGSIKKQFLMFVVSAFFVCAFYILKSKLNVSRLDAVFSVDAILFQIENRIKPALIYFEKGDFVDHAFGYGLGTKFFIPWFDYQGLRPWNIYIDTAYVTLWVKMGIFSVPYILFYLYASTYGLSRKLTYASALFLALVMLTTTIVYSSSFYIFVMCIHLFSKIKEHNEGKA